jgi:hypothetical protein
MSHEPDSRSIAKPRNACAIAQAAARARGLRPVAHINASVHFLTTEQVRLALQFPWFGDVLAPRVRDSRRCHTRTALALRWA